MEMVSSDPELISFGPPFGAPLTGGEQESLYMGRCFAVTASGGTSEQTNGHEATVLDAVSRATSFARARRLTSPEFPP